VWEQGASGERIVGARLDRIAGIEVLHDRRIPGTLADIDHIAIGPGGAYVIAAKLCGTVKPHGALRHGKRRLFVGTHDQTKLVAKMRTQVGAISRALRETPVPVAAALCIVDAHWPSPSRPFVLDHVWVGWPDALAELVTRPGLLDAEAMKATARVLAARLPPA
jgi:Nuclease-related domain